MDIKKIVKQKIKNAGGVISFSKTNSYWLYRMDIRKENGGDIVAIARVDTKAEGYEMIHERITEVIKQLTR